MENIRSENENMFKRLIRVNSPVSKFKMQAKELKQHEFLVNNNKHIIGYSKGVNARIERLITPRLPKVRVNNLSVIHNNQNQSSNFVSSRLYSSKSKKNSLSPTQSTSPIKKPIMIKINTGNKSNVQLLKKNKYVHLNKSANV